MTWVASIDRVWLLLVLYLQLFIWASFSKVNYLSTAIWVLQGLQCIFKARSSNYFKQLSLEISVSKLEGLATFLNFLTVSCQGLVSLSFKSILDLRVSTPLTERLLQIALQFLRATICWSIPTYVGRCHNNHSIVHGLRVFQVGNVLVVPDLTKLSKAEDRNRCTLSQYVHMVLSALSLNINNKAENYTDEYLQVGLFISLTLWGKHASL